MLLRFNLWHREILALYLKLCEWKAYAIIRFDLKLLILRFIIKPKRKLSNSSSGPVEGLPTLYRKVPGSNHVCSVTTFLCVNVVHSNVYN